jgi:hypothetical protein
MTDKTGNAGAVRAALALEIARRLVQSWDSHLAGRADGFKVIIHVLPGQGQARIEWPPPPPEEVKLNK